MIKHYFQSPTNKSIKKIEKQKKGSWIMAYDVTPEDVEYLISLGFDELLIEDANDYFEVPRFENEDNVNYLFTRYVVQAQGGELSTAPLLIAVSEKYFLTVSHRKVEFLDDFASGRKKGFITTQKATSVIMMIESIAQKYNKSIMSIRRTMLQHFGNVDSIKEQDIIDFVVLEGRVADYTSALMPTESALIDMLKRKRTLELHDGDIDLIEDLVQDFAQLIESAKGVSKTIQNVRNAHSSILANKLNRTMKTLTAVTIILTIPTIVASVFGMNIWLPLSNSPLSFLFVIGIIVVATLLMARWVRSSKWM